MFTGIVEATAEVVVASPNKLAVRDPGAWPADPWHLGESIAVNGCCLTLAAMDDALTFDLSEETWGKTAFQRLSPSSVVNLERAMRPETRFGGHIVQGHVDSIGTFLGSTPLEGSWTMKFQVDDDRYLINKGSVTIDGVSLTVVDPQNNVFETAIIPFTHRHTSLGALQPGDKVNIEFDVIARYVERLLNLR